MTYKTGDGPRHRGEAAHPRADAAGGPGDATTETPTSSTSTSASLTNGTSGTCLTRCTSRAETWSRTSKRVSIASQPIVIYCARGNRSALAADTLQQMGYTDVTSMADGFGGWIAVGGPVED